MQTRKTQFKIQKFKLQMFDKFQEKFLSENPLDIWGVTTSKRVKAQGEAKWQYMTQKF